MGVLNEKGGNEMKAISLKTATGGLLIGLTVLFGAVSTDAADFFPLDVWETVANGPTSSTMMAKPITNSNRKATPLPAGATATDALTFPFDVAETLNHLGDGRDADRQSFRVAHSHKKQTNPYWLPEEYQSMHRFILTPDVKPASMAWK